MTRVLVVSACCALVYVLLLVDAWLVDRDRKDQP